MDRAHDSASMSAVFRKERRRDLLVEEMQGGVLTSGRAALQTGGDVHMPLSRPSSDMIVEDHLKSIGMMHDRR